MRKYYIKVRNFIRNKIRNWLGLGEMFIGVDVGLRDQSCIIICSRLNNGTIRIIDNYFPNLRELEHFVKECKQRYGVKDHNVFWDRLKF